MSIKTVEMEERKTKRKTIRTGNDVRHEPVMPAPKAPRYADHELEHRLLRSLLRGILYFLYRKRPIAPQVLPIDIPCGRLVKFDVTCVCPHCAMGLLGMEAIEAHRELHELDMTHCQLLLCVQFSQGDQWFSTEATIFDLIGLTPVLRVLDALRVDNSDLTSQFPPDECWSALVGSKSAP